MAPSVEIDVLAIVPTLFDGVAGASMLDPTGADAVLENALSSDGSGIATSRIDKACAVFAPVAMLDMLRFGGSRLGAAVPQSARARSSKGSSGTGPPGKRAIGADWKRITKGCNSGRE